MSIKKNTTSKNNTTYTNKTQSQPSISYRHKKVSMITKSMPKLSTYFDNNIKNNQNSKILYKINYSIFHQDINL